MTDFFIRNLVAACCLATAVPSLAEEALGRPYGEIQDPDQYGPFDFYNPPEQYALGRVERAHLSWVIVKNKMDNDMCEYWHNVDYTLRAFPNHAKALVIMAEYLEDHGPCPRKPRGHMSVSELADSIEMNKWGERNMDHYFHTALRFMTEDTRVIPRHAETNVLYADWLRKKKRFEEAKKQYDAAHALNPGFANTYYGLGMLYLDQNNTVKALENAKKAYSLGKPPGELRDRLIASGSWPGAVKDRP
jgi:tetratricopeptide (TPR) repeat protein